MFFATANGNCNDSQPSSSSSSPPTCRHFQFPEIQLATNDFDDSLVIGHGGFGKVYKANLINESGPVVAAIKRLASTSTQGAAEFWAEVEILSKLLHCNLVTLIGYCNHGKEMMLVYEYMPNGTLEHHLHKLSTPLSWVQRLKICIGAARGLHYLHTGTGIDVGVIHRDVKTSNILLHESWTAKISDFGLSKLAPTNKSSSGVNTLVKGTFGYLDPDYYATGKLTRKSDVYAFGVVLWEVLCRKRAVDNTLDEEQWNLARWAQQSIKEGNFKQIIDTDIRGQISPKGLKEFVRIAQRCLHSNLKHRSTMAEVVVSLESVLTLQEKFNESLQSGGRTIFGRMFDIFPFPSNGENSEHGDSKLSRNSQGNNRSANKTAVAHDNMFPETWKVPAICRNPNPNLKVFKFVDLRSATRNFSKDLVLGEGGFGMVFLGWVDEKTFAPSENGVGIAVAVKRYSQESSQGYAEWLAEVNMLRRFAHPYIIRLLGHCCEDQELLLVYEYMQNRSFDRFLFGNAPDIAKQLSWGTRLKILIGVARGLTYLHSSKEQIIFRGVKSSSILLDQDFNAKLGNFGLARSGQIYETGATHITTRVMGTNGYAAPEYIATGHLHVKSDIYGFGVVLLETLTGLRVLDTKRPSKQQNLVQWAWPTLERRKALNTIMDPRLEQNYPLEAALKYAALTLRCLASQPNDRPSSEEVLQSLEQIYVANK